MKKILAPKNTFTIVCEECWDIIQYEEEDLQVRHIGPHEYSCSVKCPLCGHIITDRYHD